MSSKPKKSGLSHSKVILALLVLLLAILIKPEILTKLARILPILEELNPIHLAIFLIVLILFSLLLQFRRTNERLDLLAKIADKIGQGNYDTQSGDTGIDSIGRLAGSVNLMAQKIGVAVLELEESQNDLEVSRVQLEEQNRELSLVVRRQEKFGEFLSKVASIEINSIAITALDHLIDLSDSQLGLIYIYDEQANRLVCLSKKSLDSSLLSSFSEDGSMEGLPGEVLRRRKWITLEDIDSESLPDINLGFTQGKIRNLYGIPVLFQKKLLGVVILAGLRSLDTLIRQVLSNHIDALANSLINAITYRSVQKQSVQLEDANRELMDADRQKSEFVANMSHELRTPLNSIIGFSGILQKNRKNNLTPADLTRIEKINRNGRHLLNLINDILDLSKIEAGRMDIAIEDADLVPVLKEVAEMLQPQADAKKLTLKCEISEPVIKLETDSHKLKQVLINMLGNAIKFTKEGTVTLRAEVLDPATRKIQIQVIDMGIGIQKDKLEKVFEAFSQADSSTSREFGGTGLGLTISRTIIKLLGGTLNVESEFGKGSTFTVLFPGKEISIVSVLDDSKKGKTEPKKFIEVDTSPPFKISSEPSDTKSDLKQLLPISPGSRILVVDDDSDAREFISNYIKDMGAECIECDDPERVLDIVKERKPDLITLDIMMPGLNGWEVLTALKSDPESSNIPVVIISMIADKNKAILLGAVDALTKPVVQDEFFTCIRRNLNTVDINNRRILIVDDMTDAQELLKDWLDESGSNDIRTAVNGLEALKVLESFRPEVIFLDLMMPVMDGMSFLKEFRSKPEYSNIPVIIVTAKTLTQEERGWIEKRAEKILVKGEDFQQHSI